MAEHCIFPLNAEQSQCIEDVLVGLAYLKKELARVRLLDVADIIAQCMNSVQHYPNTPTENTADSDILNALELLEKYIAIKDVTIRQEIIRSLELDENTDYRVN